MPYTPPAHVGTVDFSNADPQSTVHPNHHNAMADAVDAHTDVLGPTPQGGSADVSERFDDDEALVATHVADGTIHTGVTSAAVDTKIATHVGDTTTAHILTGIDLSAEVPQYPGIINAESLVNEMSNDISDLKTQIAAVGSGSNSSFLLLPVQGGFAPDGSTNNIAAQPTRVIAGASQPTNMPKLMIPALQFGPDVDSHWYWDFLMPGDFTTAPYLRLKYTAVPILLATGSGNVVWKVGTSLIDNGNNFDTQAWDNVVSSGPVAVAGSNPGTTWGQVNELLIGLPNNSFGPNRACQLTIGRDADSAFDTYNMAIALHEVSLEYTRV